MPEFARETSLAALREDRVWDLVVVGGGATGVGCAVDAASRGYRVALVEQGDFGQGTSSRSTKLVHGGVRYLRQGDLGLVAIALEERALLRKNAPHLVGTLEFVVPARTRWDLARYGLGLRLYDVLAGRRRFGRSRRVSASEVRARVPNADARELRGGIAYLDGRFDDARLLIHLAITAAERGAVLANRVRVTALAMGGRGALHRVTATDEERGEALVLTARVVVNATGAFADGVRRLADPGAAPSLSPSQGVHLVLPGDFLGGGSALLVPETDDGRVLFVIPWHGRALLGTTDTPTDDVVLEPRATAEEVDFLLTTAGRHLTRRPRRDDVLSVFTGIRPLVRRGPGGTTATVSRDHVIEVSGSGLLTITGGKWTTYRRMAEDVIDAAAVLAGLRPRRCRTRGLSVHGSDPDAARFGALAPYGSDAPRVERLLASEPSLARALHPRLPLRAGEVLWAAREEMARTVDDVLCRRTPSLFLDARAARDAAPAVAELLASALGRDGGWRADQVARFEALARRALP